MHTISLPRTQIATSSAQLSFSLLSCAHNIYIHYIFSNLCAARFVTEENLTRARDTVLTAPLLPIRHFIIYLRCNSSERKFGTSV